MPKEKTKSASIPKPANAKPAVKRHKSPIVAAFLNLLLNGLGYVYNGKRVLFGVLLIFSELAMFAIYYNELALVPSGVLFPAFNVMLLLSFAFAVDGYQEAKEI